MTVMYTCIGENIPDNMHMLSVDDFSKKENPEILPLHGPLELNCRIWTAFLCTFIYIP